MAKGKKTGGRAKGVPNKMKKSEKMAAREILQGHSWRYISPNPQNPGGVSDLDMHLALLQPPERVKAEICILKYHLPELKSIDVDATITRDLTIEDKLRRLSEEEEE